MATEDGIVLAECVARASSLEEIPFYLSAFELIRKERTNIVQVGSIKNRDIWHMEDGTEQKTRDAIMRGAEVDQEKAEELKNEGKNPNQWSDPKFQKWLFGHDAVQEVCSDIYLEINSI